MREYSGLPDHFTMYAIDWNGGHDEKIAYTMHIDEVLYSLMYFRLYIFVMALTLLTPTNSDLFVKRVAAEKGFKPNIFFQIKANMVRKKIVSIALICTFGVLFFANLIMIWERPYWNPDGQGTLEFSNLSTSIWYVVITMSTVGYGGIVASTVPGRFLAIIAILFGAFILSLLVSVIAIGFEL
jgi:hypothetical protein